MSDEDITKQQTTPVPENDETKSNTDIMNEKNQKFQEELEELEKARKEIEEKRKKEFERIRKDREKNRKPKDDIKQEEKIIGGQKVLVPKKTYDHEMKVFRHNRLNDLGMRGTKKLEKAMKKVHGVSLKKKLDFLKAVKAYNPSKSVLKKKDFEDFTRRFKSKRFTGNQFKKVENDGIDIKGLRKKFGKRDIDKLRRGITGQADPNAYKSRSSDLSKSANPSARANKTH
ncbi:MAG: hypothetical protein P1P85_00645 [Patescibacteria group bacterium]|nr:hypothetical protein [Patescibacteria group bacterium]